MGSKKLAFLAKKSKFSKVSLVINEEVIKFNLFDELRVNQDNVNSELNNQPAVYSYLTSILANLTKDYKKKLLEKEKIFARQFIKAKDDFYKHHFKNTSDEYASSQAKTSIAYLKAAKLEIEAEEKVNIFKGIVEAFRQRANSLQQISANNRKDFS